MKSCMFNAFGSVACILMFQSTDVFGMHRSSEILRQRSELEEVNEKLGNIRQDICGVKSEFSSEYSDLRNSLKSVDEVFESFCQLVHNFKKELSSITVEIEQRIDDVHKLVREKNMASYETYLKLDMFARRLQQAGAILSDQVEENASVHFSLDDGKDSTTGNDFFNSNGFDSKDEEESKGEEEHKDASSTHVTETEYEGSLDQY